MKTVFYSPSSQALDGRREASDDASRLKRTADGRGAHALHEYDVAVVRQQPESDRSESATELSQALRVVRFMVALVLFAFSLAEMIPIEDTMFHPFGIKSHALKAALAMGFGVIAWPNESGGWKDRLLPAGCAAAAAMAFHFYIVS